VAFSPLVADDGGAAKWSLDFIENPKLPPVFRQAEAPRADGSTLTFFLANFDNALDARKPVMVVLDGSGASSAFYEMDDGRVGYGVYGLIGERACAAYHVATAEKRGVPFGQLGTPGTAVNAPLEYRQHATFEDRVSDVQLLLDALLSDPMVDSTRVLLVGMSEGADVAAGVAAVDPRVTHVAFLSGAGASQLFDLMVLRRKQMSAAGASPEAIEASVAALEADYARIFASPEDDEKLFMGHAYRRWASFFRQQPADNLARTKAKLFLAHGVRDQSVPIESFDYLTTELMRRGRTDVTIRRFTDRDHSLMKPGGDPSYEGLLELIDEIVAWSE
jgi:pimeloyl-ACP methyl ester carboxylesterase